MCEISAVVITYNEEKNIGRCLDSLMRVADEIIVLDAFSTDRTVAIAKSKGAIVKQEQFSGYAQQKNKAIALAAFDYILSLDADEALDHCLVTSILEAKQKGWADAYYMKRCTNYCGKFIRHGSWYPDKKLRLFNKHAGRWEGPNLHERVELVDSSKKVRQLSGDILHYCFPSIESHVKKSDKYSTLSAQNLYNKGKKSSWFKIWVNPFWAFLHGYIFRLGFLDGFHGLSIAVNTAHATFLKYMKLYSLQHHQKMREVREWHIKPATIQTKEKEAV